MILSFFFFFANLHLTTSNGFFVYPTFNVLICDGVAGSSVVRLRRLHSSGPWLLLMCNTIPALWRVGKNEESKTKWHVAVSALARYGEAKVGFHCLLPDLELAYFLIFIFLNPV